LDLWERIAWTGSAATAALRYESEATTFLIFTTP
jgi:hypothetical protein